MLTASALNSLRYDISRSLPPHRDFFQYQELLKGTEREVLMMQYDTILPSLDLRQVRLSSIRFIMCFGDLIQNINHVDIEVDI